MLPPVRRPAAPLLLATISLAAALLAPAAASAQPALPPTEAPAASILSLSVDLRVRELTFTAGPDLSVDVDGVAGPDVYVDGCQFQTGVVYRNVRVRLALRDGSASLTCATADEPAAAEAAP